MSFHQQSGNAIIIERLMAEIEASEQGAITFARFMDICLYEPKHGYYTNERLKIGKEGDFYTSSSVGTIMGEMLAQYGVQLMDKLFAAAPKVTFVEWGGGNGQLAKHMLDELKAHHRTEYERIEYVSIEQSDYHRQLQQETLSEHSGRMQWMTAEAWLNQGPHSATIVFSNELLDAFPVHRIVCKQGVLYEIGVTWLESEQRFAEQLLPMMDLALLQYVREEGIELVDQQQAEINLAARDWIWQVGAALQEGAVVTIDYGHEAAELYAPHRMNGTLLCYHRHIAHDNPFIHVGEQDMTSHVNFSACLRAGEQVGFDDQRLIDQKTFLLEAGIMQKLKDHTAGDPFHPQVKVNRVIRQLLWSDRMSELFKVLIQVKSGVHPEECPKRKP